MKHPIDFVGYGFTALTFGMSKYLTFLASHEAMGSLRYTQLTNESRVVMLVCTLGLAGTGISLILRKLGG